MRLLINSMILVMALAIIATAILHHRADKDEQANLVTVQAGLLAFDETVTYQSVLWQAQHEQAGDYPPQIMPDWFADGAPANPLLEGRHPWIDIAPPGDYSDHPPDPLADTSGQAGFWYNPNNGVVRARVPRQVTDEQTLAMYNLVNHAGLAALPHDTDPDRIPLAFNPDPVTTGQHASPVRRATRNVEALEPEVAAETVTEAENEESEPWYESRVVPESVDEPETTSAQVDPVEEAPARPSLIAE